MTRRNSETRWVKFGSIKDFAFISDDVIALASGIHVMFYNLITREEKIEKFDSPERGKGAACLAGHPVVPMFATAEKRPRPKILIFTYPGIRKVSSCRLERGPNGYLSCIFAGTEYLLTLTSFPDFRIIIWSWRTGEMVNSIETTIHDHHQKISCVSTSPYQVSQLGEISGNLAVYEINVCSKIVMISMINSVAPTNNKFVCASWTPDGNLLQCDETGNVTLNFNDGKRSYIVVRGEDTKTLNSKGRPLIEAFRSGLILVDHNSRIAFYRKPVASTDNRIKSASPWRSVWFIQAPSHPVRIVKSANRGNLLFCGEKGEIFELNASDEEDLPKIRIIIHQGAKYEFLMTINPHNDQSAAIDEFGRLNVLQYLTGQSISKIDLQNYGAVRCTASHPSRPVIAIGTSLGKIVLINLFVISTPSIIKIIYLQRDAFEKSRFSWSGKILGISDGIKLFLIGSRESEEYSVLGVMKLNTQIIDFLMYEVDDDTLKILILAKMSKLGKCGREIVVYSFNLAECLDKCECVIELTDIFDSLYYGRSKDEIIAVPYLTKLLYLMKIQKDFQEIVLMEALSSGHQLRNLRLEVNDNFVLTCSYDGLTIVRSKTKIEQIWTIFISHHYLDGGTVLAVMSPSNNMILSLGKNGDIIATSICSSKKVVNVPESYEETLTTVHSEIYDEDLTWIERKIATNFQREKQQCATERNSIVQDFSKLQKRLRVLLDANEVESKNARLAIADFDLDTDLRAQKIHENIVKGTKLTERLENDIFQRDQVSKYLRQSCWDSMEIHACSLLSISGKIKIDNFPVPRLSNEYEKRLQWENFIVEFHTSSTKRRKKIIPTDISIVGTTTDRFIQEESLDLSINQIRQYPSYNEAIRTCIIIRDQERKLKVHFNELFENMRSVKAHNMSKAADRLKEIKHCESELKNMFGIISEKGIELSQPLWHYSEKPETIVEVSETEIVSGKAATYLEHDIRLELLKMQEEERLKLNDSFREQALESMMDGLLEVRWEDEIKKDPAKPSCLAKDPSTYSSDEIAESKIYRIKCEELSRDREKYKKILQNKILEIQEALQRDIELFDLNLESFYLDRMKIESAILQETSMRLRELQRHSYRRQGFKSIDLANENLTATTKNHRNLIDTQMVLEGALTEAKNRYENLSKREKALDTKFRGEFPDLKQPMVEHLLRHYRKRPKNIQLTCTSITYLTEVTKCLVNCEKSDILPKDCSDFLRGMDVLDVMPNNLPVQIDTNHWSLQCKLRRAKIELEIKIKISAVDLAEAEQTLAYHQRSCSFADNKIGQLREMIKDLKTQNSEFLENMQVQLVLKMGQIESRLYGNSNEFSNSVFVPLSIIEGANKAIIEAGSKKLGAMRKSIEYRRAICWREWRHKCMRIKLNNMREELKELETVRITRELQNFLPGVSQNVGSDKGAKSCERIITASKKRCSKILQDKKKQLDQTRRNIVFWRMENKKKMEGIENIRLASFKASMQIHDDNRERDSRHRQTILKAMMKRTRLTKKVHDNYSDLVSLQTQLELLRLKTYPTLRIKGPPRIKETIMDQKID